MELVDPIEPYRKFRTWLFLKKAAHR